MAASHIPEFMLVSGIFFLAGAVKGVLGMGLPTLAVGLLGLLMPPAQAAALITVPSLLTNAWQAVAGGGWRSVLARVWPLLGGIAAGVAIAAGLPIAKDDGARMLLGACLCVYGACGLAGWRLRHMSPRIERIVAPGIGAVTGVITALTGVFVLPAVPYLQSLGLDRRELAQALGLSFTASTVALAVLLASRGQFGPAVSLQSALFLVPALAGMLVGQKLRDELGEAHFRKAFFGGMAMLGAWLVAA